MIVKILVERSTTHCVTLTNVSISGFTAKGFLTEIDWPYSVDNAAGQPTTVVVYSAELLTAKNAELQKHEKHEE